GEAAEGWGRVSDAPQKRGTPATLRRSVANPAPRRQKMTDAPPGLPPIERGRENRTARTRGASDADSPLERRLRPRPPHPAPGRPGGARDRRATARALPRRPGRGCVRGARPAARPDGLRRVPPDPGALPGRRGRLPGHLPRAGPPG